MKGTEQWLYYDAKGVCNFWGVTIQMKDTEQFFPVVLFIMLYKVVLTFETGLWKKS